AILAATIYRPPAMFSFGEILAIGSLAAAILSLVILVVLGGGSLFARSLANVGSAAVATLSNPSVLAWLAAGAATAFWLTLFTGSQPVYAHGRRARRPDRP
ncbi:MAG TPA: hypothetical protein VIN40_11370, partial [Candidatus Tyrphobacter sp.]